MKTMLMLAGAAMLATGAAAQVAGQRSLEGLWVAKERYGPDVRGPLIILPSGSGLVADVAGFSVPVRQQGKSLSFELPDGKGGFRGSRSGTAIEGHWIQGVTV